MSTRRAAVPGPLPPEPPSHVRQFAVVRVAFVAAPGHQLRDESHAANRTEPRTNLFDPLVHRAVIDAGVRGFRRRGFAGVAVRGVVGHVRMCAGKNTVDGFPVGQPVPKYAAAVLAAEPVGLIPVNGRQRRRFVTCI